ncbi:MAG: PQQ-binding-like beta-propeller repeat protein, partial [Acidobacteriota bacterium]
DTTSGPIWWAYATGATAVAPPTVGFDGVVALSNDRSVHSLERGINGGTWPSAWVPPILNGVVHSRSPIMPMPTPADPLLLVGDDSGELTAINTRTGLKAWGPISFSGAMITGAPGAFATRWGGPADVVLVGTRVGGAGYFYTRDLATGGPIDTYDGGGALGPVTTTPVLDYGTGHAYFTSWGLTIGTTTAWCVDVDAAGSMTPCTGWTLPDLDDIDASPVLENGRVYVANTAGEVYPLDPADGTHVLPPPPIFSTGDGPVKGFLFPDRRGSELYFATDSQVWSVTDTAGTLSTNWTWDDGPGFKPSIVLHWPGTDYLFVGSDGGKLYQLEISGGRPSTPCTPPSCKVVVLGDGSDHLGAPSLDIAVVPPLLHVGSEAGVVYAVEVPLP